MMRLVAMAGAHFWLTFVETFGDAVADVAWAGDDATGLGAVVATMHELVGLWSIHRDAATYLAAGLLTGTQVDAVHDRMLDLCASLVPEAAALVDAFDIPDFVLRSEIGRADGDVYRGYLARVRAAPTAKDDRPAYWQTVLAPLTRRPFDAQGLCFRQDGAGTRLRSRL